MKVLLAIPPRPFVVVDVEPGLRTLQRLVDGSIQYVHLGLDYVAMYVNEESLILGLTPNREANRLFRPVIGYRNLLCGPVLVVGLEGDVDVDVPAAVVDAVALGIWPPGGH